VNELSDSVAWPSRDPEWVTKVLLIGLINLIPIVGQLNLLGWMLAALDNLRAGRPELPPAGFQYIGRGLNLFVVFLIYGLVLGVTFGILFGVGLGITAGNDGQGNAIGVPLILLAYALLLLGVLVWYLFTPAVIVATERGGIAGGLNLPRLIAMVGADVNGALQHGLFALVAYLIGGLGAIACFIGQIFTAPYGYAVLAGVVHHYEQTAGPSAAPAL
jgi:Protein of unknown function (DUF4013)